ncbi:hypothetical protein B0T10DRAFT_552904 [Thelonectria olida]|uniref:Uncharacterized protein n=1 Tax=Thelonectria olida TaxID=1576542 RepID=A0A9P9AIG0_9HYPO|nr:hypothetical protein B0T10DRAFT_552904 [Thelonectria olida]
MWVDPARATQRALRHPNPNPNDDDDMAHSPNSSADPSPRLPPAMPSRPMPSSSNQDVASSIQNNYSPGSDNISALLVTRRNTPTLPNGPRPDQGVSNNGGKYCSQYIQVQDDDEAALLATTHLTNGRSRPKAIKLPQPKRLVTASATTPPEPPLERGNVLGSYFNFPESPSSRVQNPHPFQHQTDIGMECPQPFGVPAGPTPVHREWYMSNTDKELPMSPSNTPVTSYLLPGFYDNPLPIGKYYPSNYEQRNSSQKTLQQPWSGSFSSSTTRGSQMSLRTTNQSPLEIPESEVRHRLQQYKRDMVFQAGKAASDLMCGSAISDKKLADGMSLNGAPIRKIRFAAPALHKPSSPRLLPVDSPGPVTPMDLECISGSGTLDR